MSVGFLDAEKRLIRRLEAKVKPHVRAVLSAADLAGVQESEQITPALHVILQGYRPTREQGSGLIQEIEQTWLVVAAVRNVRGIPDAREDAGPILDAVLRALLGWRPDAGWTPFQLAAAPRPGFSRGFLYFPLAFTTKIVARGDGPA